MKILLAACNAKYIHSNLAVYDLQAYAAEYADHIVLKEYTINQQKDDIMRDIYLEHPDVVCVSCYIWNVSFVKELMADLTKILPDADFWAGGPEVSYDAEKFLTENPEFKGVMVGEGEETFRELAGYYVEKNPQDLKDMTGICYKDGEKIIHNGWRQIMDLSSIPFIYKDLSDFKNRIIYYESSRGCPFSCSYCLSSIDKKLRFRDTEMVKKDHAELIEGGAIASSFDLRSNVIDNLNGILFFTNKPQDNYEYVKILGLLDAKRSYSWIRKDYISVPSNFDYYKVLLPESNGAGAFETLSTPIVVESKIGHTQTFISMGEYNDRRSAENLLLYLKTKFCRALLGTLKTTQHNSKATWANVPLQDFTPSSDIDWSKSIAEIDEQLFDKYGLDEQERNFIRTKVKEMA